MKKLNKLLMPVVGLSTITAAAIPMAACSKSTVVDGVKVSQTEWENAFEYLAATKEGATWKTSFDDVVQKMTFNTSGRLTNFDEYTEIAFNDNLAIVRGVGSGIGGSLFSTTDVTCVKQDNCYFNFAFDETTSGKQMNNIQVSGYSVVQGFLIATFALFGDVTDYEFDDTTKTYQYANYQYDESTGDLDYAKTTVRFNSNKQITYINSHLGLIDGDQSAVVYDVLLHPQYSDVTVDVDQQYIDWAKAHAKDMTGNSLEIATKDIYEEKINAKASVILNITPKSGGEKNLTFTPTGDTDITITFDGIYKNGELLEEGTSSTEPKDYYTTSNGVVFTNELKTTDKLNVACNFKKITASLVSTSKLGFALAA